MSIRRRVPPILQMTGVDCGPSCLAMVVAYHGGAVSLTECRARLGVGRDGVSARAILAAATELGLSGRAYAGVPAALHSVRLPAIAQWQDAHFVVVERRTRGGVTIVDPAIGRRRLSSEEFAKGLTGAVLGLEPAPGFQCGHGRQARSTRSGVRAFARHLRHIRGRLAALIAASVVIQLLGLAVPIFSGLILDRILPGGHRHLLTTLAAVMALVVILHMTAGQLRSVVLIHAEKRIDHDVVIGFFSHLLSLPLAFFEQRANGDLTERLSSTVFIRELLTTQTLTAMLDGTLMLVYLSALLAIDPLFGGLVLGMGLLQVTLLLATHRAVGLLHQRHLVARAEAQGLLHQALDGITTVKATGTEESLLRSWSQRLAVELAVDHRRARLQATVENASAAIRLAAPLTILWFGTHRVLDDDLSVGTLVALQALAMSFLAPLTSLTISAQRLQVVGSHFERLGDILDAEPEPSPRCQPPRLKGRIELRGVSFRYHQGGPLVLRDVSMTVQMGQKVALVGPSGSGKSTLGTLLLGLYAPATGAVLYDGIDVRELDPHALRRQFGVVLQDPFVFGDTVRRNIALNDPDMPRDRILRAAQLAAVHEDIMRMPMGYETRVGDAGSSLSGGERQRLAIARALAHDPAILLLDEATSHLDTANERRIDENLDALDCTRVVIAHRLSTVRNADQVLVLDGGVITEQGTPDELLARGEAYARLVAGQTA